MALKQIGVTMGGTMVVELTATEAKQLQTFVSTFAELPQFPGQEVSTAAAETTVPVKVTKRGPHNKRRPPVSETAIVSGRTDKKTLTV